MQINNLFGLIYSNCFSSSTSHNFILQLLHFSKTSKQHFLIELSGQFGKGG